MNTVEIKSNNTEILHSKQIDGIGILELRRMSIERDIQLLHQWVNMDYAVYWEMQGQTVEEVTKAYQEFLALSYYDVLIGTLNGRQMFLLERYKASNDTIAEYYDVREDDYGMHILLSPVKERIPKFSWHVFSFVVEFMFSDEKVNRIVVEPDVRNDKIHVLNKKAGFEYQKEIALPHKNAYLAFCTRESYNKAHSSKEDGNKATVNSEYVWTLVNRQHVSKMLGEFLHELLLEHTEVKEGKYCVKSDNGNANYYFDAKRKALDHWNIDTMSIVKQVEGRADEINAIQFVMEFKEQLGIPDEFLPTYLEEIIATLKGAAFKYEHQKFSSKDLVVGGFQEIEHAMTEGHPIFVANNGRIGFNAQDFEIYAPEANQIFELVWLAGHKSRAKFTAVENLTYKSVLDQELGDSQQQEFSSRLVNMGLNAKDYILIPVHPWQWENKIQSIFAPDIANKNLVYLGRGKEKYSPQQSIRTLFNASNPENYYVKTALSILNMGFMRGLSPYYMQSTPPITDWITQLFAEDEYLASKGFEMLGEVATVGYRNFNFEPMGRTHAYNKMLSALWRESPVDKVKEGQQLMTMAALLHKDNEGIAFVSEMIGVSGLMPKKWLREYLNAYLSPLLHCFYHHEIVFMPHGENIIMAFENGVPLKVFMKDITEEVIVFNKSIELPGHVDRLFLDTTDEMKLSYILNDVFDGFFRFLADILDQDGLIAEQEFWQEVADCIMDYQYDYPELEEKFQRYDFFQAEFPRCCLNRLQLKNTKQMLNLADPFGSLQWKGTLVNPVAKYKLTEVDK
ncbi:GNAT family N-acetyltransferase [Aureibacter tunicatorum]|uniref:Siderophore synthetase component/RimJ/RimL family protein N-acetyltransferase n=1 Tax=Aureibacter tunicatorum TaxID=866807 RepID=A0AAE3XQR2_9BACT|nr:GNAT family N-acetyltransferase [Aureibacter tunicatorum]MDR6241023.1 siderophore synthetase component/RimJ/RimL family protein N-acetyltransferase [Aureibacter tunicatorum]BDD03801.1 hypothetical protein AUTU_12840 [Aureibacter tunicatorum]